VRRFIQMKSEDGLDSIGGTDWKTMWKTRASEHRKGAAPTSLFALFLGIVNAEAALALDSSVEFLFTR
jgi:hypothetical protein